MVRTHLKMLLRFDGVAHNTIAISSIVIAIQMIITYCKKLKYKRKIVLVTNGDGVMNSEGLDQIKEKIKEDNIELVVL